MRTHPTDPELFLVEPSDLGRDPLPERVREHLEPVSRILQWANDYLCRPHPELGRAGAVCPFTRPALRRDLLLLTVCPGADLSADQVVDLVRRHRDWFLQMEPREMPLAQYKFTGIIFPDLAEGAYLDLIEATQARLKPEYVPLGLMIGEFHPGPPKQAGLWNADFRPLRSPLPLLGTRHMVPTDWPFLREDHAYVAAYLERIAEPLFPVRIIDDIRAAAERFGLAMPAASVAPGAGGEVYVGAVLDAGVEPSVGAELNVGVETNVGVELDLGTELEVGVELNVSAELR
jgi:hypothetical protein